MSVASRGMSFLSKIRDRLIDRNEDTDSVDEEEAAFLEEVNKKLDERNKRKAEELKEARGEEEEEEEKEKEEAKEEAQEEEKEETEDKEEEEETEKKEEEEADDPDDSDEVVHAKKVCEVRAAEPKKKKQKKERKEEKKKKKMEKEEKQAKKEKKVPVKVALLHTLEEEERVEAVRSYLKTIKIRSTVDQEEMNIDKLTDGEVVAVFVQHVKRMIDDEALKRIFDTSEKESIANDDHIDKYIDERDAYEKDINTILTPKMIEREKKRAEKAKKEAEETAKRKEEGKPAKKERKHMLLMTDADRNIQRIALLAYANWQLAGSFVTEEKKKHRRSVKVRHLNAFKNTLRPIPLTKQDD